MQMPEPDARVIARKAEIVRRLQAALSAADAVIHDPAEVRAYECDALTAYRCPPLAVVLPSHGGGGGGAAGLPRGGRAGGAARRRDQPRRRGAADGGRVLLGVARMNRGAGDRLREPLHPGADRADQPERDRGGGGGGLLLRARPVEPARLRHRRQHRDELRRGALPEVRGDDQQPARRDDGADGRHGGRDRRRASRRAGLRPARGGLRLGGAARRGDRGDACASCASPRGRGRC